MYYYLIMKRLIVFIIILLIVHTSFAEQSSITNVEQYEIKDDSEKIKEVAEYLKKRQEEMERLKKKRKPEDSLRRFEILFFSSGTVAYLGSYFIAKIFATFNLGQSSELPYTYWYFIITNSVGVATYISIKDYYDVKRIRSQEQDTYNSIKQHSYKLGLLRIKF